MNPPASVGPELAFDSDKNRVLVFEERVQKTFKPSWRAKRRAIRELKALELLAGIEGVPAVHECAADRSSVVMSRLPGTPLSELATVPERSMAGLRRLVEQMLERGIARHSLPPRDVIVASDGSVGLVDFERSTRRMFPGDPVWQIAKMVTRFHLMRLVDQHAPQLLTSSEKSRLRWQLALRDRLQRPAKLRRRIQRALFGG